MIIMKKLEKFSKSLKKIFAIVLFIFTQNIFSQYPVVPLEWRGKEDYVRQGTHDANRVRTMFYNYGMAGDYETSPDYTIFHSMEWPKGTLECYSDGVTPFVLAKLADNSNQEFYIMETGYRERQEVNPNTGFTQRFNPRPGYLQLDPTINIGRSPAVSYDPRTWPEEWYDKLDDQDDPGWKGSWNGYFGKQPNADQESFCVYDDDYYGKWDYYPDSRDQTRRGMGLKVNQRGFQWANIQARDVIFWHYDISNESTTQYNYNVIFGLYMDSGVGGGDFSIDGLYESDDDNAAYDTTDGMDLVYTWDFYGNGNFGKTGYLGYAYLETPGNPTDNLDNDLDGITDEKRDGDPGQLIIGQAAIENYIRANYDTANFNKLANFRFRPAYQKGYWWTGDEDMDWTLANDTGIDGIWGTFDTGENDSIPSSNEFGSEANYNKVDLNESDQIGLTGFKLNRINAGHGGTGAVDDIVFYMGEKVWPKTLYEYWTIGPFFEPNPNVMNYNIGFLFASGTFFLDLAKTERFSLALAFGADYYQMRKTVQVVQTIYDANYQFATPPPTPSLQAFAGDGYVTLTWDNRAEDAFDPLTNTNDFEGYKIYRSTDESFLDPQIIYDAQGIGTLGPGKALAVFDLKNDVRDYSDISVEGLQFFLGNDTGLKHTFKDTTVLNGQRYFYAITAYDRGIELRNVYPSESAISVNQTLRGGLILPKNVVVVYPNGQVPGYQPGTFIDLTHTEGYGTGTVTIETPNPDLIPENHTFEVRFKSPVDSIRAVSYEMYDVTYGNSDTVFIDGYDLSGLGVGPVGYGMIPVVKTPTFFYIDTTQTGFLPGSLSKLDLKFLFSKIVDFPINLEKPNFPADYIIQFSDQIIDTSTRTGFLVPATPTKFTVIGKNKLVGEFKPNFGFKDVNGDNTLSSKSEFIEILGDTYDGLVNQKIFTIQVDSLIEPIPTIGDMYQITINVPYTKFDVFRFSTDSSFIDLSKQKDEYEKPYVVPNPYLGMASFEQAPYAQTGRGERRLEFRSLPFNATVRIYTVTGELVQTLHHDGGFQGYIAWNMRSKDNLEIAPGLYIYHVEAAGLDDFIGKFAVIK